MPRIRTQPSWAFGRRRVVSADFNICYYRHLLHTVEGQRDDSAFGRRMHLQWVWSYVVSQSLAAGTSALGVMYTPK